MTHKFNYDNDNNNKGKIVIIYVGRPTYLEKTKKIFFCREMEKPGGMDAVRLGNKKKHFCLSFKFEGDDDDDNNNNNNKTFTFDCELSGAFDNNDDDDNNN